MKLTIPNQRLFLYFVVVVSILFSASGSFLVVYNGHKDSRQVNCGTLYNELEGKARDERAKFATKQTKADKKQVSAEIDVWKKLLKQFSEPPSGSSIQQLNRFLTTIQTQIDALEKKFNALNKTQTSRTDNQYPTSDACKDGHITKEEGNPDG